MFVAFDIMQNENVSVTGRKLGDRVCECDLVNDRHFLHVPRAENDLDGRFTVFGRSFKLYAAFAKMHQNLVDRQPVQPRSKSRVAAKAVDLAVKLKENFLCQIFRF